MGGRKRELRIALLVAVILSLASGGWAVHEGRKLLSPMAGLRTA